MDDRRLPIPSPTRQITFHQLLVAARKTWLIDALQEALKHIDPTVVKTELAGLIPKDVQQILASNGIRDEFVFPSPTLLRQMPSLVGYYRLLLGLPQKTFYGVTTGMGLYKSMETRGSLSPRQSAGVDPFCAAMAEALAELVRGISPAIGLRDIQELPLLTLGSYFQGANNVLIGQQATLAVFVAIQEIVSDAMVEHDANRIVLRNGAGRTVRIRLASDPDVSIEEEFGGRFRKKVAIEIKGGTDKSNAHNRAGEAEKSHQKARLQDFRDYWTVISLAGLDRAKIQAESPTTMSWFDVGAILARRGYDWEEFRTRLADVVGIPIS